MSADELRKAAATLRERAKACGPVEGDDDTASWAESFDVVEAEKEHGYYSHDTAYIATMHPGVGLALADLLETLAYDREANGEIDGRTWDHNVVPLARLINGGAS